MKKNTVKKPSSPRRPKTVMTGIKIVLPHKELKGAGIRSEQWVKPQPPPLTAIRARKMADGFERPFETVIGMIGFQASSGYYSMCLYDRHGVTPSTKAKLRRLGFGVTDKNGILNISWQKSPTVKDFRLPKPLLKLKAKDAGESLLVKKLRQKRGKVERVKTK